MSQLALPPFTEPEGLLLGLTFRHRASTI